MTSSAGSPTRSLLLIALLSSLLGASRGADASARTPLPANATSAAAKARPERAPDALGWWHRKPGEELGLTAAQKQAMDSQAERAAEALRPLHAKLRASREALRAAYAVANWSEARKQIELQATQSAELMRARGEGQIAVLGVLTAEQRRKLATTQPHLLLAPVVRERPGRTGQADEAESSGRAPIETEPEAVAGKSSRRIRER